MQACLSVPIRGDEIRSYCFQKNFRVRHSRFIEPASRALPIKIWRYATRIRTLVRKVRRHREVAPSLFFWCKTRVCILPSLEKIIVAMRSRLFVAHRALSPGQPQQGFGPPRSAFERGLKSVPCLRGLFRLQQEFSKKFTARFFRTWRSERIGQVLLGRDRLLHRGDRLIVWPSAERMSA